MGLLWNRWTPLRTESGTRAELIDRLEAYFKVSGLKSKITLEGNGLKRIHVRTKDQDRARDLLAAFDEEQA
ncbi:hypothetical protein ACFO9Q_13995 [Paenibacillus sp. GCM10023252]|uniref:hypothetical protein n=1 Tax=Paenibacillus sp. GCM10023252 TaxID=3252649 RepID=UPI00360C1B6C